jgi:hypothetical protein
MAYGYLLAAGGSLLGSYLSAQGSKNAAQTQSAAQMQAAQIQQEMFNRIVAQEQPFIQTGYNATNALNSLMGFGGGGTPGYTSGLYGQPAGGNTVANPMGSVPNTSVGGMPNRGMGVGYEGPMSSLGGNAFTGASGSPTTMTLGGQQTSGSPGFNWGQALAAGAAGLAGGPLAALMAGKMTGNSNSFTFTDPSTGKVITVPGATDVKPTEITMPTTQMTTPGLIMDPTTGGYIGQAYYSTPVGAAREQTLNRGMSNFLGEQASNEADTYQFRRHHQRAMGGEVHAGNGWNSYVVGEGGKDARPEILHLSPGSTGYVEPNPATISAMMKKKTPTQRSTGSTLPGRMLGGAVGIGATAQNTSQQADWRPTGSGPFGSGVFGPSIGNPSNPASGGLNPTAGTVGSLSTGTGPYSTLNNNAGTGGGYGRAGMNPPTPGTPPPLGVTPGTQAYQIWQMTGQAPTMGNMAGGGIAGGLSQNTGIGGNLPQNTGPAGPGSPVNFGGPNYQPPGVSPSGGGASTGFYNDGSGVSQMDPGYVSGSQVAQPSPSGMGGLTVGSASNNPGYLMQTYTPQAFNPTEAQLENYPGYQFQKQQGDLAVQNSAAAKYGALSGAAMKDLSNYNQGLAASNYGNYFNQYQQQQGNMFNMFQTQQNNIFNRLAQLSSIGQNAAGNLGSQGANLGTGIAQANAAAGGSLAGGQLGAANAYAGAANTIPLYMLLANQGGG